MAPKVTPATYPSVVGIGQPVKKGCQHTNPSINVDGGIVLARNSVNLGEQRGEIGSVRSE